MKLKLKKALGFTLVELVIVIAIVIVLSVVSVPIYRNYVDKAKFTEGAALLGMVLSAQKAYYSEYGYFCNGLGDGVYTSFVPQLGIDARGNKYFTWFMTHTWNSPTSALSKWVVHAKIPDNLVTSNEIYLRILYDIDKGGAWKDTNAACKDLIYM